MHTDEKQLDALDDMVEVLILVWRSLGARLVKVGCSGDT